MEVIQFEGDEWEESQDAQALVDAITVDDGYVFGFDESDDSYVTSEDSGDDDEASVNDSCYVTEVGEIEDRQWVTSIVDYYEVDDTIFSEADVKEWRKKEQKLIEKHKDGYYHCKVTQGEAYEEILK